MKKLDERSAKTKKHDESSLMIKIVAKWNSINISYKMVTNGNNKLEKWSKYSICDFWWIFYRRKTVYLQRFK